MRVTYEKQLNTLNNMLIEMGALIETAISLATQALKTQDVGLARQAIAFDSDIDQHEKDIEALCLKLILHQQPVARDLRLISAALKMITDMERIGDMAADISEITIMMAGKPHLSKLDHIQQMADFTVKMVTESIDAYVNKDMNMIYEVLALDDVVDKLFDAIKFDLIDLIRADVANSEQAVDMLMIAKYFERIGDHAENIAEWVLFSITGKHYAED